MGGEGKHKTGSRLHPVLLESEKCIGANASQGVFRAESRPCVGVWLASWNQEDKGLGRTI